MGYLLVAVLALILGFIVGLILGMVAVGGKMVTHNMEKVDGRWQWVERDEQNN